MNPLIHILLMNRLCIRLYVKYIFLALETSIDMGHPCIFCLNFKGNRLENPAELFQQSNKGNWRDRRTWSRGQGITIKSCLLNRHWKQWLSCSFPYKFNPLSIPFSTTICWLGHTKFNHCHQSRYTQTSQH